MSLLVVGSLGLDSVDTPYGRQDDVLGGSASFLSVAASYCAPAVQAVGVVGDDFPQEHLDFLRSRRVDTSGITALPGRTFRWRGHYGDDMNVAHTLETQLNVLEAFKPDLPDAFRQARYAVLGNIAPELQLRVLEQLEAPKLVACDTMNFWIEGSRPQLERTLKRVNLLSINDGEARLLSGEHNLIRAAESIMRMGPQILVIKRGEHGALLFAENDIFAAPAYPLAAFKDPTGAGDSFAGGLMGYIANRDSWSPATLRQGIVMGSVLASFCVEEFSLNRFRHTSAKEVRERYQKFRSLTYFEADHLESVEIYAGQE